jgi:hypothetical protein
VGGRAGVCTTRGQAVTRTEAVTAWSEATIAVPTRTTPWWSVAADSAKAGQVAAPRRRWYVTALVLVATVLAFVAIFSVWVNRQALNTDNWVDTSTELLENKAIQTQVATFVVTQLYTNVDVEAALKSRLPVQLQPLAGPVAGGLRQVAQRAAERLLATGQVQGAWQKANRAAHQTLLKIIDDGGNNVSISGGAVTLNLRSIVMQVADQVGIDPAVANKLPASAGSLVVLRSNQIDAAQKIAKLIRRLAIVLVVLVLGMYALAVYLARGRRRETLRSVGFGFIAAGAVALIVHGLAGTSIVNSLTKNEAARPAAQAVWDIGTSLLVQAAASAITFGILLVIAAVFAGPTRYAVRLRSVAAPTLRDRPGLTYTAAAALFLALIAWAPIAAFHKPIGILIFAVLMALGTEVLRRQTAREFPTTGAVTPASTAESGSPT